jgi:hypothetical protein
LLTFADREGRTYGDPALVKAMVFPRQDHSIEQVESWLVELNQSALIVRYVAAGDRYIWFPGFEKNQLGMRKDREPESEIPEPPADVIRQSDGNLPDNIRHSSGNLPAEWNGMEIKENGIGMEGNGMESDTPDDPFTNIQRILETITGQMPDHGSVKPIQEIVTMGAIREDIQAGYDWYRGQGKTLRYYGSLVGPIGVAMRKRIEAAQPKPQTKADAVAAHNQQIISECLGGTNGDT